MDEAPSPDILASICVFDSKCARIIIDEENELVYLPYGASVFRDLVTLLQKLKEMLKAECPHPSPLQTDGIPPTTKAANFIAALSPDTTIEALEAATKWSPQDETELGNLTQDIVKATAEDPTQQARRIRNLKSRISELRAVVEKVEALLSPEVAGILEKQINAVNAAQRAFNLACQQSPSPQPTTSTRQIRRTRRTTYPPRSYLPRRQRPHMVAPPISPHPARWGSSKSPAPQATYLAPGPGRG